jgi:hypothetical protein
MTQQAYIVATLARGTASLGFTYRGRPGLEAGTLVAVSLRGSLEPGIVLGLDADPPQEAKLLPLLELEHAWPRIGALLITLARLAGAGVHEVAGPLLLDSVTASLRLELSIADESHLSEAERSAIGKLTGRLGPGRAKTLMRENGWRRICELAGQGGIQLMMNFAGTPGVTRSDVKLRRWYRAQLPYAILPEDGYLPGNYLQGLGELFVHKSWLHREQKTERWQYPEPGDTTHWQELDWPEGWRILKDIPGLEQIPLRRLQLHWRELLDDRLVQICSENIKAGRNLLLILPQLWMQQRLWPILQSLAPRLHWYGSDSGISVASYILSRLDDGGQLVLGGPAAWKLAAWGNFDNVVILDPGHPQFSADREPHLDYREALLASLAGTPARLDLLELGLSVFDGSSVLGHLRIDPPRQPDMTITTHDGSVDTDPLPLHLRQPGIRRLVHFNRLGSSRGLRCVDCGSLVDCPNCGTRRIHFSQAARAYLCPDCSFSDARLRCARCGLATLSSQLPGLEAVQRRPGDVILHSQSVPLPVGREINCVIGTSQLLERLEGFQPDEVVHVHADNAVGYLENWPQELDMLARLAALYSPESKPGAWLVSERLPDLLGTELESAELAARYMQEMALRRLALLPPYGLVYRFRLFTRDFSTAEQLRRELGDELKGMPDTTVLRLGRPVAISGSVRLSGYFVNEAISPNDLQRLRWRLFAKQGTLSIQPVRGPWL